MREYAYPRMSSTLSADAAIVVLVDLFAPTVVARLVIPINLIAPGVVRLYAILDWFEQRYVGRTWELSAILGSHNNESIIVNC